MREGSFGQLKEYKIPAGIIRQLDNVLRYTEQLWEFKALMDLL